MNVKFTSGEYWLLVVNPVSGGKRKDDILEKVNNVLVDRKIFYHAYFLTGFGDLEKLKKIIKSESPDKVIAIGGDGTCNMVAMALLGTDISMGTIPAGSANGMALDLGIPGDVIDALDIILENNIRCLDILKINERYYCLHLSDAGINAQLIYRFEHSGRRGKWTYFKEMLRALLRLNTFKFHLECNGKHYKSRAIMMAFANASRYGSGAVLNPQGKPDDGTFEICQIRWFKWYRIPAMIWHLFRGNVNIAPEMRVYSTTAALIKFKRKVLVQADGEILGHYKQLKIRIIPKCIFFIAPS